MFISSPLYRLLKCYPQPGTPDLLFTSGWAAPKQYNRMLNGACSHYLEYLPWQGLLSKVRNTAHTQVYSPK